MGHPCRLIVRKHARHVNEGHHYGVQVFSGRIGEPVVALRHGKPGTRDQVRPDIEATRRLAGHERPGAGSCVQISGLDMTTPSSSTLRASERAFNTGALDHYYRRLYTPEQLGLPLSRARRPPTKPQATPSRRDNAPSDTKTTRQ